MSVRKCKCRLNNSLESQECPSTQSNLPTQFVTSFCDIVLGVSLLGPGTCQAGSQIAGTAIVAGYSPGPRAFRFAVQSFCQRSIRSEDGRYWYLARRHARADGYPTMYLHQQQVFQAVKHGQHILVSTGTGTGKTESFLYPIIDDLLRQRDHGVREGVTAVLVYPMNALANDQLDRLRDMLGGTGITFGQWVGTTSDKESDVTVERCAFCPGKPIWPHETNVGRKPRPKTQTIAALEIPAHLLAHSERACEAKLANGPSDESEPVNVEHPLQCWRRWEEFIRSNHTAPPVQSGAAVLLMDEVDCIAQELQDWRPFVPFFFPGQAQG